MTDRILLYVDVYWRNRIIRNFQLSLPQPAAVGDGDRPRSAPFVEDLEKDSRKLYWGRGSDRSVSSSSERVDHDTIATILSNYTELKWLRLSSLKIEPGGADRRASSFTLCSVSLHFSLASLSIVQFILVCGLAVLA